MPTYITTAFDKIPDFGATPTISAIASGDWDDPAIWSTTAVPTTDDVVSIPAGVVVNYNVVSTAVVKTVSVEAGGSLQFQPDIATKLTVVNLVVKEGGELQIGTPTTPIDAAITASVVFADVALDTTNDPRQFGNGLIVLGKVTVCGAAMPATFIRLSGDLLAGDTTIGLSAAATGWAVGHRVAIPDTRQLPNASRWGASPTQSETRIISAISSDGKTITVTAAFTNHHKGARLPSGVLVYPPHLANLSRNVIFSSASGTGVRGHTYYTKRAEVDIRYAEFKSMGRTGIAVFDDTTTNAAGVVTHLGTNQSGRYAVHFNHLMGPIAGVPSGGQFYFCGNSVYCLMNPMPFRWGLTITDSSYGIIKHNVVYNWRGACVVVFGNATERNILFERNFAFRTSGDDSPRNNTGRDGACFWTIGFNHFFRYNVAADAVCTTIGIVAGSGFNHFMTAATTSRKSPAFPGADVSVSGQYVMVDPQVLPILEHTGNEAYGMCSGMTMWNRGTNGNVAYPVVPSRIVDFTCWHCWEEGFYGYPSNNIFMDGFTVIGDSTQASNSGSMGWQTGDYLSTDCTIKRANFRGTQYGVHGCFYGSGTLTIVDSDMETYGAQISIPSQATYGGPIAPKYDRTTVIDNVRHYKHPLAASLLAIETLFTQMDGADYRVLDQIYVRNYNGVAGDDFRLYWAAQIGSATMPVNTYYGPDSNNDGIGDWECRRGAPVAGLTNTEALGTYGICTLGEIAPAITTTRTGITGLVVQSPPEVLSVTINNGDIQRSEVTEIVVRFTREVTFPNGPESAMVIADSNGNVRDLLFDFSLSAIQTVAKIRFLRNDGASASASISAGSTDVTDIGDGLFTLTVVSDQVEDLYGQNLDGNGDGTAGDDYTMQFHQLFGDADGDRTVSQVDYNAFRLSYGTSVGDSGFRPEFDADDDGYIGQSDYDAFRANYLVTI